MDKKSCGKIDGRRNICGRCFIQHRRTTKINIFCLVKQMNRFTRWDVDYLYVSFFKDIYTSYRLLCSFFFTVNSLLLSSMLQIRLQSKRIIGSFRPSSFLAFRDLLPVGNPLNYAFSTGIPTFFC